MIKIACMVGAPDLETPTLAPYQGNLGEAFAKLAALGYDGIELMTRQPGRLDGVEIHRLLAENNLQLSGLCTGHVFGEDKLGLVQPDVTINREAVARLKTFIEFAAQFGPGTMVNLGRSRGLGDTTRMTDTLHLAEAAFRELAEYAGPRGVRLILEPIRRLEVNFIHSTQEGLEMARRVNHPNFGLMVDTFHMNLEDADLFDSFREGVPLVWHVHFSDSNRRHPGSATIDYARVVKVLAETHYGGFVSMEIQCWPDGDTAARASIEHIRQFIPR